MEDLIMNIREDIRPITYLKTQAADVLEQINTTHRPMIITQNGEPRAIVQDPESYMKTQRALAMLKLLAQGEQNLKDGQISKHEDVFRKLENKLEIIRKQK
jgi:prevent-host-death family protein